MQKTIKGTLKPLPFVVCVLIFTRCGTHTNPITPDKELPHTIVAAGHIYDAKTSFALKAAKISLRSMQYERGFPTYHDRQITYPDSNGYYGISYNIPDSLLSSSFDIAFNSRDSFVAQFPEYIAQTISVLKGVDIKNDVYLLPAASILLTLQTNNSFQLGDSLKFMIMPGMTMEKVITNPSDYTLQASISVYMAGDEFYSVSMECKRIGNTWSTFSDTVFCDRFTQQQYVLHY